ncbi:MAG TPA: hypothetical protein VHC86_04625 [Opitutaceae bacterium]|nr:hypothetical protein [Opitutaceae bacterium]
MIDDAELLRRYSHDQSQAAFTALVERHLGRIYHAAFRWIHDGCRHTGATYYKAMHGVAATSELLMHVSGNMAVLHYCGFTTHAEAEKFFTLTPDSLPLPRDLRPDPRTKVMLGKEELASLVREMTITQIAERLGCSDAAVTRRCQKLGIRTPGRGHWVTRTGYADCTQDGPATADIPGEICRGNVVTMSSLVPKSPELQRESNTGPLIVDQITRFDSGQAPKSPSPPVEPDPAGKCRH